MRWFADLARFVGGGYNVNADAIVTSDADPDVWTPRSSIFTDPDGAYITAVARSVSQDLIIAVGAVYPALGSASGQVASSADGGDTWSAETIPWVAPSALQSVEFFEDLTLWLAGGYDGGGDGYLSSPDGSTWTSQPYIDGALVPQSFQWDASRSQILAGGYPAFGSGQPVVAISSDGFTWTGISSPFDDGAIYSVWIDADYNYWAAGNNASSTRTLMQSTDGGLTWSTVPTTLDGGTAYSILGGGGVILQSGYNTDSTACLSKSSDGVTWSNDAHPFDGGLIWDLGYDADNNVWATIGYDSSISFAIATGTPSAILVSVPVPPLWRNFVAALDGSGITDYSKLTADRKIEVVLNAPLSAEGTVPSDNPQVWLPYDGDGYDDPYLSEGSRLMWWFRKESSIPPYYTVRAATIVNLVQDDAAQDNARTRFVGHDPWTYMFSRLVRNLDGSMIGENGISWTNTKVAVIIGELLRNTIDARGHAYIDGGDGTRVGEGSQYGNWGGTEFFEGTLEALPVIDYVIPQGTTVGQAWQALCKDGYCDIILKPIYDPINRPNYLCELNVYAQAGQTRDEAIFAWNAPGRSLTGISRLEDGSQRANQIYYEAGQGGSIGAAPVQEDITSQNKYGKYEAQQFFPGYVANTPDQVAAAIASVTGLASDALGYRKNTKTTVTFTPAPERSPRPWQDYNLGDRVPVWVKPQGFRKLLG